MDGGRAIHNGTIDIGFDLGSQIYCPRAYDCGFHGGDFFRGSIVTFVPGETQTFNILVRASLSYCQFTFEMTVAIPYGMFTENIDDNGKPFELSGEAKANYAAEYVGSLEAMFIPALDAPEGNFVQVNPETFHAGSARRSGPCDQTQSSSLRPSPSSFNVLEDSLALVISP